MIPGLDAAEDALIGSLGALKNQLMKSLDYAMAADKSSLKLGMSFTESNEQLTSQMGGLRGDLGTRFVASMAGMSEGLQGNTAGIGRLVNQQQLTGTAFTKTAAIFAKMEMTLGISRESTNKLADSIPELGKRWKTSTDVLVEALDGLADTFVQQKLAGMGAGLPAAVMALQGEVGKSMAGPLGKVMKAIFDTSESGWKGLTLLGIGNVREQLSAATSDAQQSNILKKAIVTASNTIKNFTGNGKDMYRMFGVATEQISSAAFDFVSMADALGKRTADMSDSTANFGDQMGVFLKEILIPFQDAFREFFPLLKDITKIVSVFAKGIVQGLVDSAIRIFLNFDDISGKIKALGSVFATLGKSILRFAAWIEERAIFGLGSPNEKDKKAVEKMLNADLAGTFEVATGSFKGFLMTVSDLAFGKNSDTVKALDKLTVAQMEYYKRQINMDKALHTLTSDNFATSEMDSAELRQAFVDKLTKIKEELGLVEENTKVVADQFRTTSTFLDESSNLIGRGIESMLGMNEEGGTKSIVEALQIANEQREAQMNQNPPNSSSHTSKS
tara:strand:+ start:2144 stop:3820 length:1677 start_codon:yes stop_codon:yes gene_type:complete